MPIAMSRAEWARIRRWTDPNKEDPEAARQRAYVKHLDEISTKMTRDWPNSLENVNKRNEELRRARIEVAEQANTKFYKRYVKCKREEQQRLMYSARDMIFKNKDAPKLLLSAVIETTVQKERAEQVKFNEARRREEAEQKRRDDDEVGRRAGEWHALQRERRRRRLDVNKQHQKEILDQAHEVAERKRIEYESELQYQRVDNMRAAQQMEELARFEANFKAEEKRRIWADMERSKAEAEQRRAEVRARDQLDGRLLEVLLRSRARVEAKRKQTEKEVKEEKLRVLEKISQRLESGDAARDAAEAASRERARLEKEAIAERRRQAQQRKQEEFVAARRAARAQFLAEDALRRRRARARRQWEVMNRFKNAELYEEFQEKLRKEKEQKIKEFREDTLRLWKEREEREARERAETRHFYGELAERELRDADNALLTHARALLAEARARGRPEHALRQAVDRYCKLYRLYPMPELPSSMQEHFTGYAPWDGSAPDAGYRAPPPPPPDRGPDAPDEEPPPPPPDRGPGAPDQDEPPPPPGKRDGLQADATAAALPKPAPAPAADDYRRAGRANGLQRRNAQADVRLPPVAAPCRAPSCSCALKPRE